MPGAPRQTVQGMGCHEAQPAAQAAVPVPHTPDRRPRVGPEMGETAPRLSPRHPTCRAAPQSPAPAPASWSPRVTSPRLCAPGPDGRPCLTGRRHRTPQGHTLSSRQAGRYPSTGLTTTGPARSSRRADGRQQPPASWHPSGADQRRRRLHCELRPSSPSMYSTHAHCRGESSSSLTSSAFNQLPRGLFQSVTS